MLNCRLVKNGLMAIVQFARITRELARTANTNNSRSASKSTKLITIKN